jgi:hypothetical protein
VIASIIEKLGVKFAGPGRTTTIEPPRLSGAVRSPYGGFQFQTRVTCEVEYQIEVSTNLKNWVMVCSGVGEDQIDYVDAEASKFGYRFYRMWANGTVSSNIIGYATVALPPGFSMVANPLESEDAKVAALFKGMPDGTAVNKFDVRIHKLVENIFENGKWTLPNERLVPGEGAMVFNPSSDYKSIRFMGTVMDKSFMTPIPAGVSIRSSLVPQPGKLDTDLGFPLDQGDVINLYDREKQNYVSYPYDETWGANPAVVNVGESFWIAKQAGRNWSKGAVTAETKALQQQADSEVATKYLIT